NAKGEWICFLDSDDLYTNNHLEVLQHRIAENLKSEKNIAFYFTEQQIHYSASNKIEILKTEFDQEKFPYFFASGSVVPGRVCIKKNVLEKFQFDKNIVIVEDADLWFRISCYHNVEFIDK